MQDLAKYFFIIAGVFIVLGIWLLFAGKWPSLLRLPGDIFIKNENTTFYFPITTCIVISIIINVILWLFKK